MGNAIYAAICGAIGTDKYKEFRPSIMSNFDRRYTINISYRNLHELQECIVCDLISRMAKQAKIRHTYSKSIVAPNPDTGKNEVLSFQMPSTALETQDINGIKIRIVPDGEDGYCIKASGPFWENARNADETFNREQSHSDDAVNNFMDNILKSLKAKRDKKTPTIENAQKISFWGRMWRNIKKAFCLIMIVAILLVVLWIAIHFLAPIIVPGFAVAFFTQPLLAAAAIPGSVAAFTGLSALVSVPAGAIITTCSTAD